MTGKGRRGGQEEGEASHDQQRRCRERPHYAGRQRERAAHVAALSSRGPVRDTVSDLVPGDDVNVDRAQVRALVVEDVCSSIMGAEELCRLVALGHVGSDDNRNNCCNLALRNKFAERPDYVDP